MSRAFGEPTRVRDVVADGLAVALVTVVAVFAAAAGWHYLQHTLASLARPLASSYTGGLVGWLALHPEHWFAPLQQAPHVPTIYPPVALLVDAVAVRLSPLGVWPTIRLVGQLASLGTAGLLAWVAWLVTDRRGAAVLAGGLWLLSPAVSRAIVWARVDHLGLLFAVGALAAFVHRDDEFGDLVAVYLCIAAGLVKPTLAVVGIAMVLALLVRGATTRAVTLAFAGGSGYVAIMGSLWHLTDGRALTHLFAYNGANALDLGTLVQLVQTVGWVHLPVLALAGLALAYGHDALPPVVPIAAVLTVGVGVATAGKTGAWLGYFYPALALAVVLAAWVCVDLWPERAGGQRVGVGLVLALLAVQAGLYASWAPGQPVDPEAQAAVVERIDGAGGPVLAEDVSLLHAAGTGTAAEPLVIQQLVRSDSVADPLLPKLRAQQYAYVVVRVDAAAVAAGESTPGRWTEAQLQAVAANYERVAVHGGYRVYAPAGGDGDA